MVPVLLGIQILQTDAPSSLFSSTFYRCQDLSYSSHIDNTRRIPSINYRLAYNNYLACYSITVVIIILNIAACILLNSKMWVFYLYCITNAKNIQHSMDFHVYLHIKVYIPM